MMSITYVAHHGQLVTVELARRLLEAVGPHEDEEGRPIQQETYSRWAQRVADADFKAILSGSDINIGTGARRRPVQVSMMVHQIPIATRDRQAQEVPAFKRAPRAWFTMRFSMIHEESADESALALDLMARANDVLKPDIGFAGDTSDVLSALFADSFDRDWPVKVGVTGLLESEGPTPFQRRVATNVERK